MNYHNDKLTKAIAEVARDAQNDSQVDVLNFSQVKNIEDVKRCINKALCGDMFSVNTKMHEPFQSVGVIYVEGKSVVVRDAKLFAQICRAASNCDIYPQNDGKVCMAFTFHGLTIPLRR